MTRRDRSFRAVILLVGLALAAGCSNHGEVAPTDPAPDASTGGQPTFLPFHRPPSPVPLGATVEAKLLKAKDGGELSVAGARVKFPAGALPADMLLTLTVVPGENVTLSVVPAGIPLLKPALVQLDDARKTDHGAHEAISFYLVTALGSTPLPTSYDGDKIQSLAMATGEYVLAGDGEDDGPITFVRYLAGSGYLIKKIEAERGGEVTYDRVKVKFPAGALDEDTYITVRELDTGSLMAELEPHGIEFNLPVQLEIDLHGLDYSPYLDWHIYWLNEASDVWEDQGGVFEGEKVKAGLWHFSTYAPGRGRAGW